MLMMMLMRTRGERERKRSHSLDELGYSSDVTPIQCDC